MRQEQQVEIISTGGEQETGTVGGDQISWWVRETGTVGGDQISRWGTGDRNSRLRSDQLAGNRRQEQ